MAVESFAVSFVLIMKKIPYEALSFTGYVKGVPTFYSNLILMLLNI